MAGGGSSNQGQHGHHGHHVPGSEAETEKGSSGLVNIIRIIINVTSQPDLDATHNITNATAIGMQDSHDDKNRFGVFGSAVVEKQEFSQLVMVWYSVVARWFRVRRDQDIELEDGQGFRTGPAAQETAADQHDILPDRKTKGYDELAMFMARDPPSLIFRRFDELNIKNLLYLQAELTSHELALQNIVDRDSEHGHAVVEDDYAVPDMILNANNRQWKLILKIRKILKQYNTALQQYRDLRRMSEPHASDLRNLSMLRNTVEKKLTPGDIVDHHLLPLEQWQRAPLVPDRVALCSPLEGADPMTRWSYYHLGPLCYKVFGPRKTDKPSQDWSGNTHAFSHYRERGDRLRDVGLSVMKGAKRRLWFAIAMGVGFVTLVGFMVPARRAEIIVLAAAYAAIEASLLVNAATGQSNIGSPGH
ncbi:hypothetical protein BO86DRAFT_407836 [Aspergillus japonicus CBS 114.51]|uniref:DUF6594 domain-containing protein n=1 Tax=Aspergillus japonicus CBS 114.51 TaxID=1448312 RepID=A0A8T8X903_ASPJA|nr:hypothetical protein BO86DRAFT_407836 [Aspergillus japonicus CBS 114.51]RAH84364.1 hypothetical protein BO86DRAFT_407836 [Aspergillus japonicus CBS 114.51]